MIISSFKFLQNHVFLSFLPETLRVCGFFPRIRMENYVKAIIFMIDMLFEGDHLILWDLVVSILTMIIQ